MTRQDAQLEADVHAALDRPLLACSAKERILKRLADGGPDALDDLFAAVQREIMRQAGPT